MKHDLSTLSRLFYVSFVDTWDESNPRSGVRARGFRPNGGGGTPVNGAEGGAQVLEDAGSLVLNGIMSGDESAQRATHGAI